MNFLNPLPIFFWLIPTIPIIIFLINRRKYKVEKFSTIKYLLNLKTTEINRLKLINILLLILRTLILIIILMIIMRPTSDQLVSSTQNNENKVVNHIYIDDSFSNKFGLINNQERSYLINDIINNISNNSQSDSKLKIATFKKGFIYNDFNSNDINYINLDDKIFKYNSMEKFLTQDSNYVSNIHLISNSNISFIEEAKQMLTRDKNYNYNIFYHYIPISENNQYISNVDLINNIDGKFIFEIGIGNSSPENILLNIGVYNNFYNFDNNIYIEQQLPLYSKQINLKSYSNILDTIQLELDLRPNSEIVFKLENLETKKDLSDDRVEDNYNSFIFDIPDKINALVLYDNESDRKYLHSILSSFKIVTNNLDSNFFNVEYIYTKGVNQYSNLIESQNLLIFCGYDLFLNSHKSIISDHLKSDNSHLILFPSTKDALKNNFLIELNDSLVVQSSYNYNNLNNYDTVKIIDNDVNRYRNFINHKIKLNKYFSHTSTANTKFKVSSNESVWTRYKFGNNNFDLFGLILNEGNNIFSKNSITSAPFLYKITLNELIDYTKNNQILNEVFINEEIEKEKYKIQDLYQNIIEVYSKDNPLISTRNTKGIVAGDSLYKIVSFNPSKLNFSDELNYNKINTDLTKNIINYDQSNKGISNINKFLYRTDLSKYFIYTLLLLLIFEMILANARPSRSE